MISYIASAGVKALFTEEMIKKFVKTTMDMAYERNMTIVNRFNFFTVDGKVAVNREILKAVKNNPASLGQVLVIVGLTEEKGEDVAHIVLQSEIESNPNPPEEMTVFCGKPPEITVADLIINFDKIKIWTCCFNYLTVADIV